MAVAIVQTADVAGVLAVSNICTYTNVAIGTASVDRIVVVCCGIESASIPQSATIGGAAMSATPNGNFGSMSSMLFYKAVPAGTTATIAITFSGAVAAAENHITVYAVTGAAVTPLVVGAGNGSTDMDSSAALTTGALTVPTGGGIIACAVGATNTTTMTWSANVAADINASHLGNYTFGTALGTSAITATAVTCTGSVNNQAGALGWLVFGPAVWPVPGVGTLSLAGTTPTRSITELISAIPAAGSLSLTTAAPTVSMPADTNLVPAAAALTLSGPAPAASTFVAGQYDETGETAAITLP